MRIGIDARESGTSTGRYVDGLVEHLAKLKSPHHFVLVAKPERVDYLRKIAPKFEIVETKYKEFTFGEQYGLCWQVYGLRLDLMHFTMAQQPILYFGRVVTTIQDLTTTRFNNPAKNIVVFKFKQWVYRLVIKRVVRKSKRVISISDWVKYDTAHFAHVPTSKITTTHPAYGRIEGPSAPYPKLKKGKRFIMYLGRPMPHKNLERLVDAYAGLRTKYPQLRLVFVGKTDANYQRLADYVKQKALSGVDFTDWLPDDQAKWLYEQAVAYVVPSLSEGFGMPGLEAMDYGTPVASSWATCSPEVYRDGALYFDPLDVEDMAAKIEQIVTNKALAETLGRKGQKVAKSYDWRQTAKQTLAVYDSILKPDSPADNT